jgi:hypothetical protein
MQKSRARQEMLSSDVVPSSLVTLQALARPVGSVDVTTSPCRVIAAQKVTVGHEMAEMELAAGSTAWVIVHPLAVPPGTVEVRTSPDPSAATQNERLGHETAVSADAPGSSVPPTEPPLAPVSVYVAT